MLVFPHASVTVQLFVVENVQPEPVSDPTVPVAVNPLLQLSVTVAAPNAAAICAAVGLHGSDPAAANVITGGVVSTVQVNVAEHVAVPQPVAVHVNVRVVVQPLTTSVELQVTVVPGGVAVTVKLLQVGILEGLHPKLALCGHPVSTGTGVTLTVLQHELEAVFPALVVVTVTHKVYVPDEPATTFTVAPVDEPEIVPLPEIVQANVKLTPPPSSV